MIQVLNKNNFDEFKTYCLKYRFDHDESYLYDEDLKTFIIGEDNPTYLLYRENEIQGVCSFILDEYHLNGNKSRARIFHCKSNQTEDYKMLLEAVIPFNQKVERLIMFVPSKNVISRGILENLGFYVERYSYVMERTEKEPVAFTFPDGYELTDYVYGKDDDDYLNVRNKAFSTIKGSETPHTKEQVANYMKIDQILSGGVKILRYMGDPVGVIKMESESEGGKDYSFVAPLAILPEHQGKGLGSSLLRAGIQIGYDNGYKDCMLTVNGENENALKLYYKEGFDKTVEVVCYNYKV